MAFAEAIWIRKGRILMGAPFLFEGKNIQVALRLCILMVA
jgi:hypothetical protein